MVPSQAQCIAISDGERTNLFSVQSVAICIAALRLHAQDSKPKHGKVPLTAAADVWAYGCLLFAVLAGKNMFQNVQNYQKLCTCSRMPEILEKSLAPAIQARVDRAVEKPAGSVILTCLRADPFKRKKSNAVYKALVQLLPQNGNHD